MQLFDTFAGKRRETMRSCFLAAIKIILGFFVAILLSLSLSAPAQWSYPRVGGK